MKNNYHYNNKLRNLAKANRKNPTKAEKKIWYYVLSKRQLMGYRFLRQRPIGNYIADFLCKELLLVIEVDGSTHEYKHEEDVRKDETLRELGFEVLRFKDDEVMEGLNNVREKIEFVIRNSPLRGTQGVNS